MADLRRTGAGFTAKLGKDRGGRAGTTMQPALLKSRMTIDSTVLDDLEAWPTTEREARAEQERLRGRVEREDRFGQVRLVGALDAHEDPLAQITYGAAVLLRLSNLAQVAAAAAHVPTRFPYIPGFLTFREAPAMLAALAKLDKRPDIVFVDGQGIAHPRRFGIASHVGVLADLPTIGVGKSRLWGRFVEPGIERGAWSKLTSGDEVIGAALRTRRATNPLFISTGHRVSLESAIALVLRCTGRYRLPEPIRAADRLSREHAA